MNVLEPTTLVNFFIASTQIFTKFLFLQENCCLTGNNEQKQTESASQRLLLYCCQSYLTLHTIHWVYFIIRHQGVLMTIRRLPIFPASLTEEMTFSSLSILASFDIDKDHGCIGLSLDFLSCSIDLYFCFCPGTILFWS